MLGWLTSLLGPIFAKEALEIARRKRYYANRVLFGLALLFVLFVIWEDRRWQLYQGGRASIHAMARVASEAWIGISCVQFGAVFVFVPLFVCGVLAGEREEGTLDLLFTTRLTNREMVLGKLGSRFGVFGFLILFTLPIQSLLLLFGGIDPAAIWRVTAATLLAMLYAGSFAIYFSATTRTTLGALVRTYWWLAFWLVGLPTAILIPVAAATPKVTHPVAQFFLATLLAINPVGLFLVAVENFFYNMAVNYLGEWCFPALFTGPTAWSAFLIWRATRQLRRDPIPLRFFAARWATVRRLGYRLRRRGEVWGRWWRTRPERTWYRLRVQNPFWLRARRARVYDREGYIGRIQWAGWLAAWLFLLLMALFNPRDVDDTECSQVFLCFSWLGIGLLAALFAGASLAGDRRRGFLELALVTRLTASEVIDGTLLAVWHHVRRLYWLPWLLAPIFVLNGASPAHGVLASLITATLFGILIVIHGVACSLTARTVPGALVGTFAFPLAANVGVVFFIAVFQREHGPLFWVACAAFWLCSTVWIRRSASCAAVACFLIAVHLLLGAAASCWTWRGEREEYPVAAMHAAHFVIQFLDKRPPDFFRRYWPGMLTCYWMVLLANIVWARWWVIRNFDRLAGRTVPFRTVVVAERVVVCELPREALPAPAPRSGQDALPTPSSTSIAPR